MNAFAVLDQIVKASPNSVQCALSFSQDAVDGRARGTQGSGAPCEHIAEGSLIPAELWTCVALSVFPFLIP
jgi:hypothetical protein